RHLVEELHWQGTQLKHQGTQLGAQSFERGFDEVVHRTCGIEKTRVRTKTTTSFVAQECISDECRRLYHEAEIVGHLHGIGCKLGRIEWTIVGAVDADAAQKRMLRVGRQTM